MASQASPRRKHLAQGTLPLNVLAGMRRRKKVADNINYEIILYWSKDDQAFIAEVPELPGCAADGATYQEAVANAEAVIRE